MPDPAVRARVTSRGDIPVHVVDGLPMPGVVTQLESDVVVRVNPEFEAAYGHTLGAVGGRDFRELHFVPNDRDLALEALEVGDLESVEVRIRTAEDVCCWAQADVSRFDMDGQAVLLTTLYDIGGRKKAEREAAEGAAIVAEMARFPEMNPGPVLRLDLNGIVHRANAAARRVTGQESLVGVDFRAMCPVLDNALWQDVLKGAHPVTCEEGVGDSTFAFTLARDPGSDQVFVFGADISELKAAERELAERARFPEMNPGPVARTDRDGVVLRANRAASTLFETDSIQGRSWFDLCPGMSRAAWDRMLDAGTTANHEADFGERCLSFIFRHEPISDQVFVYGSDVTELKMAERVLAELARFPDLNPGPVLRLARSGEVLLANPAAKRIFSDTDPVGRRWFDLCAGVDAAFWDRVWASDTPLPLETKIGGRDYLLTHARGPEGIFVFVYGSDLTDQKNAETALRQSEKMATMGTLAAGVAHELNNPAAAVQRAAEQMQQFFAGLQRSEVALRSLELPDGGVDLLQELDDRARNAACSPTELDPLERSDREYELETWLDDRGAEEPWVLAAGLADLGYDKASLDALGARVGDANALVLVAWQSQAHGVYGLMEEIRHGSARLAEVVGAMKAYAYLGQAPLQKVDVNEGLRNTLVILRSKMRQGVVVQQELDADLPRIQAYGSDLNQVWTNLLDNAVDAMNGSGTIVIRSAAVDGYVVIDIEDDGPGIPLEIQPRLFDAFFTTKPPGKGTGLGLNTTYKIVVDKHGGSIDVDSEPGRTRFTVRLPLVAAPLDEHAAETTTEGS